MLDFRENYNIICCKKYEKNTLEEKEEVVRVLFREFFKQEG
jgi:hypothetical protein